MHRQYSPNQVETYFYGNPKAIGEKVLFIKRENRLAEYKPYLTDVHEFGHVWHGLTGSFRGEQVSIIATGIGPSLVGDAVCALGRPNTTCLYSGTCGGLAEGLEIGDYFIADQAVCGEGYTQHLGYSPFSEVSGDSISTRSLALALVSMVERFDQGLTFTTSSVVREADPSFWNIVDKRCRAIDMGAAAFHAAARATDKRAAAYFWVTDLPLRRKSFFDPSTPEEIRIRQDRFERTVLLDLELLVHL